MGIRVDDAKIINFGFSVTVAKFSYDQIVWYIVIMLDFMTSYIDLFLSLG